MKNNNVEVCAAQGCEEAFQSKVGGVVVCSPGQQQFPNQIINSRNQSIRLMKTLKYKLIACALLATSLLGFARTSMAQSNPLAFPVSPAQTTVSMQCYFYYLNESYFEPNDPALFRNTVLTGASNVFQGVYPAWCVDITNDVDSSLETYQMAMISSLDTTLDQQLEGLGAHYHFTYPPTDTNTTYSQWNQLNYMLNHFPTNGNMWDEQAAVWATVGGPLPPSAWFTDNDYPPYDTNNVAMWVDEAISNSPSWRPVWGNAIGAILADTNADLGGDFPAQIIMMMVPVPPNGAVGVTKQVACLQPGNNCGSFGATAAGFGGINAAGNMDSPAFCYEIVLTNSGTAPLTNVTVVDSLLGNLTTEFFPTPTTVFPPCAAITNYFTMASSTSGSSTVSVQGQVSLGVTNSPFAVTNGVVASASASASVTVAQASVTCAVSLTSPNTSSGGGNILILPEIITIQPAVVVDVVVSNTGASALSGITITPATLSGLLCTPPPSFSLPAGGVTNILMCYDTVVCPISQNFGVTVNATVDSDANHCGTYDANGNGLRLPVPAPRRLNAPRRAVARAQINFPARSW